MRLCNSPDLLNRQIGSIDDPDIAPVHGLHGRCKARPVLILHIEGITQA